MVKSQELDFACLCAGVAGKDDTLKTGTVRTHLVHQVEPEMPHLVAPVNSFSHFHHSTDLLQRDGLNPLHGVDVKHINSVLAIN